jgi:hypothetical protein
VSCSETTLGTKPGTSRYESESHILNPQGVRVDTLEASCIALHHQILVGNYLQEILSRIISFPRKKRNFSVTPFDSQCPHLVLPFSGSSTPLSTPTALVMDLTRLTMLMQPSTSSEDSPHQSKR